jgi:hypothetical protein
MATALVRFAPESAIRSEDYSKMKYSAIVLTSFPRPSLQVVWRSAGLRFAPRLGLALCWLSAPLRIVHYVDPTIQ